MNALEIPVTARPSKTEAARMLRVDKSTLGRHAKAPVDGGRSHHLAASEILDLNERFKRRVRTELAAEIIGYAAEREPSCKAAVEAETLAWFTQRQAGESLTRAQSVASLDDTLESLMRHLDDDQRVVLQSLVDRVSHGERLQSFVSDAPDEY